MNQLKIMILWCAWSGQGPVRAQLNSITWLQLNIENKPQTGWAQSSYEVHILITCWMSNNLNQLDNLPQTLSWERQNLLENQQNQVKAQTLKRFPKKNSQLSPKIVLKI